MSVLRLKQEPPGGLRTLLLESLQYQDTAVAGHVRNKGYGRVVVSLSSSPPQTLILRLLAGERLRIHKRLCAFADCLLALAKVQFVLE